MSNIRHFYSNNSEWQRITGRGFIKTFDADEIPEGMWNPGDLTGTYCRIDHDGKIYKILGVEMFRPLISPEDPYDHPFGLLVATTAPLIPISVKKTIYRTDLESLIEEFQEFLNTVSRDAQLETPRMQVDGYAIHLHGERWLTYEELENYNKGLFDD
jgi:hypothetical protein